MENIIEEKTPQIFSSLPAELRTKLITLMSSGITSVEAFDSLSEEEQVLIEKTIDNVTEEKEE